MAGSERWFTAVIFLVVSIISEPAVSNPQTNQIGELGCSKINATDVSAAEYSRELNASVTDLKNQLSAGNNTLFATTSNPIYALAQCRNYLSKSDCLACLDFAVLGTRNCSINTGARIVFDGCFFRYEANKFYSQATDDGNYPICSKRSARNQDVFNATAQPVLNDLVLATPRIDGFYAATMREVPGGGATAAYAVAQCVETLTQSGCHDCLTLAYNNIQGCLLKSAAGRSVAAGCFLRYSNKRFFLNNQTTNLEPFLRLQGGSSSGKKKAIIGGVVGGVGILLVLAAIFLLYRLSKKPKAARRGDILGATQLRGPENYGYKDLKAATKGFSQENKLGEGGFGDVYKGTLKNGDVVAVKKLVISSRAKADFDTEVRLITNVHHRNLIRLLGCSAKGEELLLVYEYMANASLDRYIYGSYIIPCLKIKAWKLYENENYLELADKTLEASEYKAEEVKRMLEIALVCTQSPPNLRPSMSEVVIMLSSDRPIFQNQPKRPSMISDFDQRILALTDTSATTASSTSHATASFSGVSGR
nr:cysteine-rich receptor-like protein kinase 2 [Ipomoea batatas]